MTFTTLRSGASEFEQVERPDGASACRFIAALVAAALGVSLSELRDRRRGRAPVAHARQAAMYLAHVNLGLNLSRVGENFGRDRTTVAHACARVEDCRDDPKFERIITYLEAALDHWLGSVSRELRQ